MLYLYYCNTGTEKSVNQDPRLIVPVCDAICCCLPEPIRRFMWCGVDRDADEDQMHLQVQNQVNSVEIFKLINIIEEIDIYDDILFIKA